MKKNLVLLVIIAIVFAGLTGCKTNTGLRVFKVKNNLYVEGISDFAHFDPTKKLNATDSLAINSVPRPADRRAVFTKVRNKKNQFVFMNGAKTPVEVVISQEKLGTAVPSDYLFAFKAVPVPGSNEYKLVTLIDGGNVSSSMQQSKTSKKKRGSNENETYLAGESNTFDMYGSEIKAVPLAEPAKAGENMYLLSFDMNANEPITLIHYAYNNRDFRTYDFDDPDAFKRNGDNLYSIEINLRYGNRFNLITADDKTANISPDLVKRGKITLTGVELIENPIKSESGFYVFRIIDGKIIDGSLRSSVSITTKSTGDDGEGDNDRFLGNIKFNHVRNADFKNYRKSGYMRIKVEDLIDQDTRDLFMWLAYQKDHNGETAIGLDDGGTLYPTVIISPSYIKKYPRLYNMYKNDIKYPK